MATKIIWGARDGSDVAVYADRVLEFRATSNPGRTRVVTPEGIIDVMSSIKNLLAFIHGANVKVQYIGDAPALPNLE